LGLGAQDMKTKKIIRDSTLTTAERTTTSYQDDFSLIFRRCSNHCIL